jgi:hypothetical protein
VTAEERRQRDLRLAFISGAAWAVTVGRDGGAIAEAARRYPRPAEEPTREEERT